MKKKCLALLLVLAMVFGTSMAMFANGYNSYSDTYEIEYIDFYDLYIVDFFDEHTGLNVEILNDPEMLEWFLYSREIMRLQACAVEAYNLLMSEFIVYNRYGGIELIYRDDYAGAFIDDNHNLIIQLTNLDRSMVDLYKSLVEYSDVVSFTEVEFSFNELNEFGRTFVDALSESDLQVVSHGISTISNSFRISLYYADAESVSFKNNFDSMSRALPVPIIIDLSPQMELDMLEGGSEITAYSAFSVGATGVGPMGNALVTTGHFNGIRFALPVRRNGVTIGTVYAFRHGHLWGGIPGTAHGDWAIIQLNATGANMMTSRLRTGEHLGPMPNSWGISPVGTFVTGTGASTLSWGGWVAHINQNFGVVTGVSYVTPSGPSLPTSGDSGGTIVSGSAGGGLIFDGVHLGRASRGSTIVYWAYTPFFWFSHLFTPRV